MTWLRRMPSGAELTARAKERLGKRRTCEGDPLHGVNLHRCDGPPVRRFLDMFGAVQIDPLPRKAWRVTRRGRLLGWVELQNMYRSDDRPLSGRRAWVKGSGRHWVGYTPDGMRVNMNSLAAPRRRGAVEYLVSLADPKHRRRRGWCAVELVGGAYLRKARG